LKGISLVSVVNFLNTYCIAVERVVT
jgi:hypothetical protein